MGDMRRCSISRWDERGHATCPAACRAPRESERHAGREVGCDKTAIPPWILGPESLRNVSETQC
jgi:hypothetical protein